MACKVMTMKEAEEIWGSLGYSGQGRAGADSGVMPNPDSPGLGALSLGVSHDL